MFYVVLVCLFVCLSVCHKDYLPSNERICMKLLPEVCSEPTPGRRLVPAWHESDRPYTYKANRDIKTSRFNAGPPSTTMDQHRASKVYRGLAGFG